MHEDLLVLNHAAEPVELELRVEADSDFADLFEVKDALVEEGNPVPEGRGRDPRPRLPAGAVRTRDGGSRVSSPEGEPDEQGVTFRLTLEPKGSWQTCIDVVAASNLDLATGVTTEGGRERRAKYAHGETDPRPYMGSSLAEWLGGRPAARHRLGGAPPPSTARAWSTWPHSVPTPTSSPGATIPAAGLPWFMAVFGRDSRHELSRRCPSSRCRRATLRALARLQGTKVDVFRDEEPGKILHEVRSGELTVSKSGRIHRTSEPATRRRST